MSDLALTLTIVGTIIAFGTFGARLWFDYRRSSDFEDIYPKIEELVAIHSLVAWKSPDQHAPDISETDLMGEGSRYELQCTNIQWGTNTPLKPGALLNCFIEPRSVLVPAEGEIIESTNIVSNPDNRYEFSWKSHFGYELTVHVNRYAEQAFSFQEKILAQFKNPCSESGDFSDGIHVYQIEIENLPSGRSIVFYTASGHIECFPNGSVDLRREWVFYLDHFDKKVSVGELNRFMQTLLRQMNIVDLDPTSAAPKLEALWRNKDRTLAANLISSFEKTPDLSKIGNLLSSKK